MTVLSFFACAALKTTGLSDCLCSLSLIADRQLQETHTMDVHVGDPTITRARWEVRWIANHRVVVVDFQDDLAEALRIYTKALLAGRSEVTLRSKNVGFVPPSRLRPYTKQPKKKTDDLIYVTPLAAYNTRGWWWCPYCIKLRKFQHRNGFYVDKIWVPEPGYHCPMCGISHRDGTVGKWNPLALRLREEGVRKRRRKS